MLAAAASPCALFALGSALGEVPVHGAVGEVLLLELVHLVGHPVLVRVGATFVHPEPSAVLRSAPVTAASPTAATVFVVAQRADRFPASSIVVLVTHAGSILALSVLVVLLNE